MGSGTDSIKSDEKLQTRFDWSQQWTHWTTEQTWTDAHWRPCHCPSANCVVYNIYSVYLWCVLREMSVCWLATRFTLLTFTVSTQVQISRLLWGQKKQNNELKVAMRVTLICMSDTFHKQVVVWSIIDGRSDYSSFKEEHFRQNSCITQMFEKVKSVFEEHVHLVLPVQTTASSSVSALIYLLRIGFV